MRALHKIGKNYTLPISAVVLALSAAGLLVSLGALQSVAPSLHAQLVVGLGPWSLWVLFLSALGALGGAWYAGEQVYRRRKFERLIGTDKRHEFVAARKKLEELAKGLPDAYKPRIAEKEVSFAKSKRA